MRIGTRRLQFGLRSMMVMVGCVAVLLWAGLLYWRSRQITEIFGFSDQSQGSRAARKLGPESVPTLVRGLRNSDVMWRIESADTLRRLGPTAAPAVTALRDALKDAGPRMRTAAVQALRAIGPKAGDAVPDMIPLLDDLELRSAVIWAMYEIRAYPHLAIPALTQQLNDNEQWVRIGACRALGSYGDRAIAAVPSLNASLDDPEPRVRVWAAEAICKITTDQSAAITVLIDLLNENVGAGYVLGNLGPRAEAAVPALVDMLRRSDVPDIGVVEALGKIGPVARDAVPEIVRAMGHAEPWARIRAVRALGNIGSSAEEAVPSLISALADASLDVRLAAAEALGFIGPVAKEAVPTLLPMLNNEEDLVRRAAGDAIAKIDPVAAREAGVP